MKYDIIIAGAGFCGSIIAYLSAKKGKRVLLLERRKHIAGNMFDEYQDGVLVQRYGPHIFHTNDDKVYTFVEKLCTWVPYELQCQVFMEGKLTPSPFNFQTIDDYYSVEQARVLKQHIIKYYNNAPQVTILDLLDCSDKNIREYAEFLFEKDYKPYTCKQWGISPNDLDKSVLARVPVALSYRNGYFTDKYQMIPRDSYSAMFKQMLSNTNITVKLNTNVLDLVALNGEGNILYKGELLNIPLVYTGPIDELFACKYGKLPYRSLRFEYETIEKDSFQNAAVVAYPQEVGYTRIVEYTKLPHQNGCGKTVIAKEYPVQYSSMDDSEPYYPIPSKGSYAILDKYLDEAKQYPSLFLGGRLADYKYYNMDQVVKRALELYTFVRKY